MVRARSKSMRSCCPADEPAIEMETGITASSLMTKNDPLWRFRFSFTSSAAKPLRKSIIAVVISGVGLSALLRMPSTVIAALTASGFTTKSTRDARL